MQHALSPVAINKEKFRMRTRNTEDEIEMNNGGMVLTDEEVQFLYLAEERSLVSSFW